MSAAVFAPIITILLVAVACALVFFCRQKFDLLFTSCKERRCVTKKES